MSTFRIELEDDTAARLGDSPDAINDALKALVARELYRQHAISGGCASQLLGLDRLDFMRLAGSRGIPVIDSTPEQWQAELAAIDAR